MHIILTLINSIAWHTGQKQNKTEKMLHTFTRAAKLQLLCSLQTAFLSSHTPNNVFKEGGCSLLSYAEV